ncbi:cytochrome P450 4C1-like [Planococcus citri]|uniref:cytochrome P450 4C1-like n=1 Tax=Planococcus citri TaxID=170843 RepID=UPI0031F784B1
MMLMLISSLIFIIMLIKNIDQLKNKQYYKSLEQFPSFPAYPLIGNLNMLLGSLTDLLKFMEKTMSLGDRLLFWLGPMPILFLKKYDDIATVLNQTQYRDWPGFGNQWFGIGMVNAKYEEWKISRKVFTPAFTTEMMSKYFNTFEKNSSSLVETFKPASLSGEIINVWEDVIKVNIDTITENTVGVAIEGMGQEGKYFSNALHEGMKMLAKQAMLPWLQIRLIYNAYLKLTGRSKLIDQFHALPTKILKDKLNEYKIAQNSSLEDVPSSKAIIDQLIKGGLLESSFTEIRMRDELTHIIMTAIETTALNLCFLMLMLAIHQDVQQKVYEEIEEIFKDNDTLTADHLFNGLKYTEQCIKETSRRFTHAIITTRRNHKECILKDNMIIPANTLILAVLHLANQDPDLYKNPQKWDPEHFSEQAIKNRPKNSFMSFGHGPRSCIGIRYAMLSVKTSIVYLLRDYHLTTNIKEVTNEDLTTDLSIRRKLGYLIKFLRRKQIENDNTMGYEITY